MGTLYTKQKEKLSKEYWSNADSSLASNIRHSSDGGGGGQVAAMKAQPINEPLRTFRNIDLLTPQEMEAEFQKIYERSSDILYSLHHNPCEQLSLRIQQCLEHNSLEMTKCFAVMNSYQSCVADARREKLLQSLKDLEMN